jgi:hypothetical protein
MAYDVEMIGGFLEHLKWSLIVDEFEFRAGPEAYNLESAEKLQEYYTKRGTLGLLSLFGLTRDRPELTEEQIALAIRRFAKYVPGQRAEQLRHLETLEGLCCEARAHAVGRIIDITVPASKVLEGSWEAGPEGGSFPGDGSAKARRWCASPSRFS